jgi:hypothetical protein
MDGRVIAEKSLPPKFPSWQTLPLQERQEKHFNEIKSFKKKKKKNRNGYDGRRDKYNTK